MPITMKDIAKAAGVSTVTVSKIVNGQDRYISQETREKVQEIIKASGYVPNSVARSLKTHNTKTIGFILPDITNPFYPAIARGIEDEAGSKGYAMVMCNTDNSPEEEKKAVHFLNSKMVDGIIFIHSVLGIDTSFLKNIKVPLVAVDRRIKGAGKNIGKVYIDTEAAMLQSTKLLLSKGCKKIALVSAPHNGFDARIEGYFKALKEADIKRDDDLVYLGQYDSETGYSAIENLFSKGIEFDGVACGNDLIAIGVLKSILKHGKKIPEDIKVIGFDDNIFAGYTTPALTSLRQPAYEMGRNAAKMMIDYLTNGTPMRQMELPFSITLRETV